MFFISEKNSATVTVIFKDENQTPVMPDHAWWSLYCLTTKQVIRGETPILNLGSNIEIVISADDNSILKKGNAMEKKVLTVRFTYSDGNKQGIGECQYQINRLLDPK